MLQIQIEIEGITKSNYDENNPLALPSEKRKTEVECKSAPVVKRLSKKERKKLEKLVDKKEKKTKVC